MQIVIEREDPQELYKLVREEIIAPVTLAERLCDMCGEDNYTTFGNRNGVRVLNGKGQGLFRLSFGKYEGLIDGEGYTKLTFQVESETTDIQEPVDQSNTAFK